jgi:exodeoxyribonuclease X
MALLRVIDFETTGLTRDAEVVEVGYCDFDPETRRIHGGDSYLCGVSAMPPEVRAIHHIRIEEVRGLPRFDRALLVEYAARSGVDAFVAHQADFEAQFLTGSIPLVCTYKAALRTWPGAPSHSNFGLLYWLEDQGLVSYEREKAQPPHRALPDAYVTATLLGALYAAGVTGRDLMQWTREPAFLPTCPIGEHRGKPWPNVPRGFLDWMTRQKDMDADRKWNAQQELNRRDSTT